MRRRLAALPTQIEQRYDNTASADCLRTQSAMDLQRVFWSTSLAQCWLCSYRSANKEEKSKSGLKRGGTSDSLLRTRPASGPKDQPAVVMPTRSRRCTLAVHAQYLTLAHSLGPERSSPSLLVRRHWLEHGGGHAGPPLRSLLCNGHLTRLGPLASGGPRRHVWLGRQGLRV